MGFMDTVKGILTKKPQKLQEQPPVPPRKEMPPHSALEEMPPPKVTDFDDEIPELPDLELPEELSKEKTVSPPEPQPKSPVVPPPQGQATQQEAKIPEEPENEDIPPLPQEEEASDDIEFEKIEAPKLKHPNVEPIETEPTPQEEHEEQPEAAPTREFKGDTTYVKPEGHEFVREFAFSQIVTNLKEVDENVVNSQRFETLMDLDAQKQKAVREFQKQVKGVLQALDEIDRIAFKKR